MLKSGSNLRLSRSIQHFNFSTTSSTETLAQNTLAVPTSSCPKGTILKGINVLKDKSDPVAKADEEYPSWVWDLAKEKGMFFAPLALLVFIRN